MALAAVIPNIGLSAKIPLLYEIGSTHSADGSLREQEGPKCNSERKLSARQLWRGALGLNWQAVIEGEFANTVGTDLTRGKCKSIMSGVYNGPIQFVRA
jgi:hypothetical protein